MRTRKDEPRPPGAELVGIAVLTLTFPVAGAGLGFTILSPLRIAVAIMPGLIEEQRDEDRQIFL
ncbi:MAG TPA: hypothetical protein VHX18_05955 [Rhizomicrobium sp.]|jgi:hypothetical protein|nr:hypothetical protein [Rhizomicrobium sp.]